MPSPSHRFLCYSVDVQGYETYELRFLDLGSRVVFPVAYIIFILVTMAKVNFGYDHYALLRPTDVSALATSISQCYCKQTADDYCVSRGL